MNGQGTKTVTANGELENEIQRLRGELQETRQELSESRRLAMLASVAGGMAHELRQPVTNAGNLCAWLRSLLSEAAPRAAVPENRRSPEDLLDEIEGELDLAARLISNFLGFIRTHRAERRPVELNGVIRRQAGRLSLPPGVRLELDLAPVLPVVCADPLHIGCAFENLAENALQSMDGTGEGELRVCTYAAAGGVVLEVRDSGPGIPAEIQPRVFEPLFSTRTAGVGIGLALSRQLMEANEGTISFTSRPGFTCFRLEFPAG